MRRLALSSLLLFALVLAIARGRGRPDGDEPGPRVEDVTEASVATPVARAPEAAKTATATKSTAVARPDPFPYPRELEGYRTLAAKVFLTEDETRARRGLLHDARVLKAAARLVRTPLVGDATFVRDQDAALALLLESRRAGDAVATEALTGVVVDQQVEDATLDRGVREQLAGLKAEVLYEWSADAPGDAAKLEAMLPGPVSQRLWQNVRDRQSSNLAESAAEKMGEGH